MSRVLQVSHTLQLVKLSKTKLAWFGDDDGGGGNGGGGCLCGGANSCSGLGFLFIYLSHGAQRAYFIFNSLTATTSWLQLQMVWW